MPTEYTKEQIIQECWSRGRLKYKVRSHQLPIYQAVWDAINAKKSKYVINCARRYGKTTVLCIIALEFAIRNKMVQIRFAAPSAKQLEKIIFPIINKLIQDCPEHLKPQLKNQVYKFPNGSEIHLAGVDAHHAESLRGVASHLNILDEAGSMDNLKYVMTDILMPLTLTTNGCTLLASTPAPYIEHDYTAIAHDARESDNFIQFTIDDNASLTAEQRARAVEESGGEQSTTYQREYLCQFVTDTELVIIPEWDKTVMVQAVARDQYYQLYHKYVAMDIGFRDNTAVLFGYYDFTQAALVIEDELTFSAQTMVTDKVAKDIMAKEKELWGEDVKVYRRIADNNDPRLLQDFATMHQLSFAPTSKEKLTSMVNETRIWIGGGRVLVHPRCVKTIGCIQYAIWKKEGTIKLEFAKSSTYAHYDHLAALIYLIRNVDEHSNPIPVTYHHTFQTHINPHAKRPVGEAERTLQRAFRPRSTRIE